MKTLFVDESGNLGTKDRYFVLAMLAPQNNKRIINLMKRFCAANNLPEIKASKLSFPQKQGIFNKLCSANDYTVSYIVADKQNIDNKKLFDDKNLCFNYLFSFLVNKTIKSAQEDLCILLDNHSTKVGSINSLADYIKIKSYTQLGYKHNLQIAYTNSIQFHPRENRIRMRWRWERGARTRALVQNRGERSRVRCCARGACEVSRDAG